MRGVRAAVATFLIATVVGAAAAGAATADEPPSGTSVPPRPGAALLRWIRTSGWRDSWTPEPHAHASAGPHGGRVRTWYNPTLVEDLASGRRPFRKDAAMVKALYGGGGKASGWAVMRKVRDGKSAGTWWFFETTSGSLGDAVSGRGIEKCAGCHSAGRDYLRSRFRP